MHFWGMTLDVVHILVYIGGVSMKKRDLLKVLKKLGWSPSREGGNHELWVKGEYKIPIPRHREIREGTAKSIIKQAKKVEVEK